MISADGVPLTAECKGNLSFRESPLRVQVLSEVQWWECNQKKEPISTMDHETGSRTETPRALLCPIAKFARRPYHNIRQVRIGRRVMMTVPDYGLKTRKELRVIVREDIPDMPHSCPIAIG